MTKQRNVFFFVMWRLRCVVGGVYFSFKTSETKREETSKSNIVRREEFQTSGIPFLDDMSVVSFKGKYYTYRMYIESLPWPFPVTGATRSNTRQLKFNVFAKKMMYEVLFLIFITFLAFNSVPWSFFIGFTPFGGYRRIISILVFSSFDKTNK